VKPEKTACSVWQISKRGGVGSERKNFLLAGCQNPLSRITEAKEILRKSPFSGQQSPSAE